MWGERLVEEHATKSSRRIALAIEARKQRYPQETPYIYQPLVGEDIRWDEKTREAFKAQDGNEYWRHDEYM